MFKDVNESYYLKERVANSRDDQLLPVIQEKLTAGNGSPTVLYIHLLGSHLPFHHRYPAQAALFPAPGEISDSRTPATIQQLTAEYDNSIAFSDRLLALLLMRLKGLNRPAFLLYFSDHGEAVYPGMAEWRPRNPDANACYEVPLFVWLSPEYRRLRPGFAEQLKNNRSRPHQTDRLLYGILDLCGITYRGFPHEDNLFSPHYRPRTRYTHEGKKVYHKTLPRQSTIFP